MKKRVEVTLTKVDEMVELEPYGVTTGADQRRPVMLFRAPSEEVLPVWLSPIDAGIAVTQHQHKSPDLSPHDVTIKVLESLGVRLERCEFTAIKGLHQYVELHFSGSRKLKFMTCRADQAISFCLQAGAKFFCRPSYIHECRVLNSQIVGMTRDLKLNPHLAKNRHPYLN